MLFLHFVNSLFVCLTKYLCQQVPVELFLQQLIQVGVVRFRVDEYNILRGKGAHTQRQAY